MKKYKITTNVSVVFLLFAGFIFSVSANSSWAWISEKRPYDLLPFVALATLLIETLGYNYLLKIENFYRTFSGVLIGNLISFAVPYIGYSNTTPYAGYYTLTQILNRGPFYTVGAAFLIITILVELPFMYFWLKKEVENKKKLVAVAILLNTVTTIMVAVVERVFCEGYYA